MMKKRKFKIYNEELLLKIIGLSALVFLLKGGRLLILLMFIYFLINEQLEKKKHEDNIKKMKEYEKSKRYF